MDGGRTHHHPRIPRCRHLQHLPAPTVQSFRNFENKHPVDLITCSSSTSSSSSWRFLLPFFLCFFFDFAAASESEPDRERLRERDRDAERDLKLNVCLGNPRIDNFMKFRTSTLNSQIRRRNRQIAPKRYFAPSLTSLGFTLLLFALENKR